MLQHESFQLSCPYFNNTDSSLDEFLSYGLGMDDHITHFESSPPFTTDQDSHFPALLSDELVNYPFHVNKEDLDPLSCKIEEVRRWLEVDEEGYISHPLSIESKDNYGWNLSQSMSASDASTDVNSIQAPLILPAEDMEIDKQLSLNLLAKAYGEAMEMEQAELAEVIASCIREKVSPVGEIGERLLYHSFHDQAFDKQANYLKEESSKIFEAAFKAIYQMFPNGMLAHFTANSAILEAIPHDVETIHIVDFDMGEGVQWSSMIEALAQQQQILISQQKKTLKLTSIKWREEDCGNVLIPWRFEETKRRLHDHARSFGLKLEVEEIELQFLMREIKKMNKRGGRREWLAFNCMWALPHMGRRRSRRLVMEFIGVAKDLLANSSNNNYNARNKGIITFCEGDAWEKLKSCPGFGSFFDIYMEHYQALLESMEWNFPICLPEARIAMECLFVAPYVSSLAWMQKWGEMKEECFSQPCFGLEGWRVSNERLMEAKEMVREGESWYRVRLEGENNNEMVLEWKGTPLVRVSAWG